MGFFSGLFSDKKTETSNTTNQGRSWNEMSDDIQKYWQSISGMYDPSKWQGVGPNGYQQDAAGRTAGFVNSLYPAVGGALGIGQQGLDPGSISRFMNPYTTEAINATMDDMRRDAAVTNAGANASAAKMGALGGSGGITRRNLLEEQQGEQRAQIASKMRDQGFNSAAGLANQSLQAQLAGFNAAGSLAGQQGALNNAGFQQGTQLWNQGWQNATMPYQIGQWGAGILGGLAGQSGQHSWGQGTGTSTTTATPSPFSIGANLAGLAMQFPWSDERVKENIAVIGETFDGQPIYRYNYIGDPRTTVGLMAQDVEETKPEAVVEVGGIKTVNYDRALEDATPGEAAGLANGGSVDRPQSDPHAKFKSAFEAVSGLMARARGGSVMAPYAGGGAVSESWDTPLPIETEANAMPTPAVGNWETTVTPAGSGFDWGKAGKGLQQLGQQSTKRGDGGGSALARAQDKLSGFMRSTLPGAPVFAAGGPVWDEQGPIFTDEPGPSGLMGLGAAPDRVDRAPLGEAAPSPARAAASAAEPRGGWLGKYLPGLNEGHWVGDEMTPTQRLGTALMSIRGPMFEGPTNGMARSIMEQQKDIMERMRIRQQADQFAKQLAMQKATALGSIDGQDTLEARRLKQAADQHQAQLALSEAAQTGIYNGKPTVAARTADSNIANDEVTRKTNEINRALAEEKLEAMRNPAAVVEKRKGIAVNTLGFKPGTPEFNHYVATGDLPSKSGTAAHETTRDKEVVKTQVDMAEKDIRAAYGANDVVKLIDQLRTLRGAPNFEGAVGPIAGSPKWQTVVGAIPGTQTLGLANPELNSQIQRYQAQLSLAGGEKMKGLGAQSDADAARLEKAISDLSSARSKKEFDNALAVIENSVASAYNRGVDAARQFPELGRGMEKWPKREVSYSADQALQEARDAIARGANRDAVMQRLRDAGINTQGL